MKHIRFIHIAVLALAFSVFAGCGGSKKGDDKNQPPPTYTVTFNTNGGSTMQSVRVNSGGTIQTPAAPTREDYTFEGWYSDSGFLVRANFPYPVTQNTTLYARWTWIECYEIRTPSQLNNIRNNLAGEYRLLADISLFSYANWVPIGEDDAPFTGKIDGDGHKITDLKINRRTEVYGGLFGYVNGGEIINLALENVNIAGGASVGAIAGRVENSTITNCHSSGNIGAILFAGGIAGYLYNSTIANCYSTGDTIASLLAGGIAGYMTNSDITDCHSTGNIASDSYDLENMANRAAGGIAGLVENSMITKSYSTGNISSYSNSGGIAGLALESSITGCYSNGDIYAIFAGGIVGVILNSDITNCYSTGDVAMGLFSGGIAGYIEGGMIINGYSRGIINAELSAGGIAGYAWGSVTITNCAAINMTINSAEDAGRIVGYIKDEDVSLISNNFALDTMQAADSPFYTDQMNHGISKTDAQLKTQSTYSGAINGDGLGGLGWKFGSNDAAPWKMPAGGGYPIFYWQ